MERREIETKARKILEDHGLLKIPVDPLKVAKALGIKVLDAKFSEPDKSGAVTKRNNVVSIFVNHKDHSTRKRFTIAHELGHLLIHMQNDMASEFVDSADNFRSTNIEPNWNPERLKEWEANLFAAALLMDELLVREEWQQNNDLGKLAWRFQVSESAMAIRLSSMGLEEDYL